MKIRYAVLIPVFFAAACSNDQPVNNGQDTTKKDTLSGSIEIPDESSNSTLPSPLLVASIFKRAGLKYLPGLTNKTDKASSYTTTFSRAENMGVYSSDMAYSVLNKQSNDGTQLLSAIRDLGTKINLGKVFEESSLYDRFNKNIANEDSLGSIIAEIQYKTDEQLDQNQANNLYGVIFAGAWVESMYIGGQVYRKDGNEKVVSALIEQLAICKNIIIELKSYEAKDATLTPLIADLQGIQDVINATPCIIKLNANPDIEFNELHPEKNELEPVIKKIEELRNKIING